MHKLSFYGIYNRPNYSLCFYFGSSLAFTHVRSNNWKSTIFHLISAPYNNGSTVTREIQLQRIVKVQPQDCFPPAVWFEIRQSRGPIRSNLPFYIATKLPDQVAERESFCQKRSRVKLTNDIQFTFLKFHNFLFLCCDYSTSDR